MTDPKIQLFDVAIESEKSGRIEEVIGKKMTREDAEKLKDKTSPNLDPKESRAVVYKTCGAIRKDMTPITHQIRSKDWPYSSETQKRAMVWAGRPCKLCWVPMTLTNTTYVFKGNGWGYGMCDICFDNDEKDIFVNGRCANYSEDMGKFFDLHLYLDPTFFDKDRKIRPRYAHMLLPKEKKAKKGKKRPEPAP